MPTALESKSSTRKAFVSGGFGIPLLLLIALGALEDALGAGTELDAELGGTLGIAVGKLAVLLPGGAGAAVLTAGITELASGAVLTAGGGALVLSATGGADVVGRAPVGLPPAVAALSAAGPPPNSRPPAALQAIPKIDGKPTSTERT
jgi:hypothetical protein